MERDDDGRRWFAAYLKTPAPPRPHQSDRPHCPIHSQARMLRILGQRWYCPRCARDPQH
jgi:hypothetical protein